MTYEEDLTNCHRVSIPALTCTIPILSLKTQPYTIPWGAHIYAKIIAINAYGHSEISEEGNGAQIITYPDAPNFLLEDFD